jgi:Uma2 family endonuclease
VNIAAPRIAPVKANVRSSADLRSRIADADHDSGRSRDLPAQLRTFWEDLDLPHGWRAEIIEESVFLTPPAANIHNSVAALLHEQLVLAKQDECAVHQMQAIEFTPTGDVYIPDLLVYPREKTPPDGNTVPADHALLVVEITSKPTASRDRERKMSGYADGAIPLYLLVDPLDPHGPHVTLYSKPEGGAYQSMMWMAYGEVITLPEPFDLKIDTGEFPRK